MAVFDDTEATEKLRIYDNHVEPQIHTYGEAMQVRFGDITIPRVEMEEPLKLECQHFVECVRERTTPLSDSRDGIRVVRILEAAQQSLEQDGIPVRISGAHGNLHSSLSTDRRWVAARHNSVIFEKVRIGRDCQIGCGVIIHAETVIGDNVRIDDHTVIGKLPMKAALSAITQEKSLPPCVIEDECLVGALSVLYRGCTLRAKVMIADLVSVREEVEIGASTIVGRGVTVENKVRIGERCKLETEAYITALSEIGDGCFIAPR